MKIDKTVINTINKQNVINVIRNNGPIYKAEISRLVDLSIPTVMRITDEFIKRGLIREIGKGESSGGKPPQLLEFIPDSHYIIGVDVGTTNIITILMDLSAKIIYRHTIPTGVNDGPKIIINRIIDSINNVFINGNVDKDKILGIGIGMPGLLDSPKGIVNFSPDFKWENVDLVGPIREAFQMTIIVENVTRAMAMGEKWFGLGQNCDNYICVNLGYGIGAAIMVNGELYLGSSGSSGEFGHMTVEKNGPLCDCGNYGCLEALASANAISKKAKLFLEKGEKSSILELVKGNLELIEAKTVFDAAKQGDRLALSIVMEAVEYLGIQLASMVNFMDPELIILEGGVTNAGEILIENLRSVIERRKMKHAGKNTQIVLSELGGDAAALGAASFLLKRLIESGGNVQMV